MIVLDASVVLDFLLGRPDVVEAVAATEGRTLHAPEVLDLEVVHALRRLVRTEVLGDDRAALAIAELAELPLVRVAHAPLLHRIWELRDALTAYDAAYLALAEGSDAEALLTRDAGLASRAAALLGDARVRRV